LEFLYPPSLAPRALAGFAPWRGHRAGGSPVAPVQGALGRIDYTPSVSAFN